MKLRAASWKALWSSLSSKFMLACPNERSTRSAWSMLVLSIASCNLALLVDDTELTGFVTGLDDTPVHLTNIAIATECHGSIELFAYDLERQRDTLAAKRLHAVEEGAADEHRACA